MKGCLLELADTKGNCPKRSYKAFKKFSHNSDEYIDSSKILMSSNKITQEYMLDFAKKKIKLDTAYYMDEFGGEELPTLDCIKNAFDDYGACIIVFGEKFAFIKEEASIGSPIKTILSLNPNN